MNTSSTLLPESNAHYNKSDWVQLVSTCWYIRHKSATYAISPVSTFQPCNFSWRKERLLKWPQKLSRWLGIFSWRVSFAMFVLSCQAPLEVLKCLHIGVDFWFSLASKVKNGNSLNFDACRSSHKGGVLMASNSQTMPAETGIALPLVHAWLSEWPPPPAQPNR